MGTNTIKKYILIILGSISLVLGAIGIFIPVLPTTPFLLLASFCYIKSSKKLYNWLINHKVFGTYIYNYMTHKAVTKQTKTGALLFLWLSMAISIFIISSLNIRILLAAVAIAASIYISSLKTLKLEDMQVVGLDQNKQ